MKKIEWSHTLLEGQFVSLTEAEAAVAELGPDWRLPTVDELQTILDRSRYDPAIDTDKFPDTKSLPYWTSTPLAWDSKSRWLVSFNLGIVIDVNFYSACVRACREVEEEGR